MSRSWNGLGGVFLKSMPNSDADTPMRMVMVMGENKARDAARGMGARGERRSVSSDDG